MVKKIEIPTWQSNFEMFYKTHSIITLYGNIYDKYIYNKNQNAQSYYPMVDWLNHMCTAVNNDQYIVFYSLDKGLYDLAEERGGASSQCSQLKKQGKGDTNTFEAFAKFIKTICQNKEGKSFTVIVPYASHLCVSANALSEKEHQAFADLKSAFLQSTHDNKIIFVLEALCDLPDFMIQAKNITRNIMVSNPDQIQRKQCIQTIYLGYKDDEYTVLADVSQDMYIKEIEILSKKEVPQKSSVRKVKQAYELFKIGYKNDPWKSLDKKKVLKAEEYLKEYVQGQDEAIRIVQEAIKRAWTGMGDLFITHGSRPPRAHLFFTGPTGVGKTELAKSVAELIFGSTDSMIRFDMGEFSAEASAERLVGAPPGYVGYEAGGQLTEAVKEKPFSLILFDEIEKAHPKVLDKFLSILEDGVLTDGKGETVSFRNAFIIFTSNLGANQAQEISEEDSAKQAIEDAVKDHFLKIGKPEMFGRFTKGGIIIFNRINETTAQEIMKKTLSRMKKNLKESQNVDISWLPCVETWLFKKVKTYLDIGGRGVQTALIKYVGDPLSDYFIENNVKERMKIKIKSITENENGIKLNCDVEQVSNKLIIIS